MTHEPTSIASLNLPIDLSANLPENKADMSDAVSDIRMRTFEVWAPNASESVDLVLRGERVPMQRNITEGSYAHMWSVRAQAAVGEMYGFVVDDGQARLDPRGLRLPDGPHGLSLVYDHNFTWTDTDWSGVELDRAVFYEMHVGTFTPGRTFDAAIERLDHLVDLGVDIVEVMPIASFPGDYGWGYDGVAPYAVHEPYGGPDGFKRFVDAAHARGLGVCLDVVYNHLGPDGNYLGEFGPYFTDKHHTPWGWALNTDGPHSDAVRRYIIDNATMWLRDFHVDALRLDAVHEIHDERALSLLEELSTAVEQLSQELGRPLLLIAESDRNDPATVTPQTHGGLGLAGQWADDVHHALHVALTGETQGYYGDFAGPHWLPRAMRRPFRHDGCWSSFRGRTHGRPIDPETVSGEAFIVSLQTHDQVGNRATGDRLCATIGYDRLRLGAALLLTSPYTPMLFMGEEWGASTPWQYFTDHVDEELQEAVRQGRRQEFAAHGWDEAQVPDPGAYSTLENSTLNWEERSNGEHESLLRWYKALLALRSSRRELRAGNLADVTITGPEGTPIGCGHGPATTADPTPQDADTTTALEHARHNGPGAFVVHRGSHRIAVNLGAQTTTLPLKLDNINAATILLASDPTICLTEDTVTLKPDGVVVVGPAV
ncbi:malto-oligosyltrehalose trehalohydrolase [Dermatophilus congolensis]|uniref:malto-oligosyltrehalose trehalohydrolase n=1 Tax=Dermatophilus congolensis TaxID=1863 RepID=UPI001FB987FF|nr:malto-oligosyltrehalose trehalohydrolase [Dermatophilus congolensis]